MSSSVNRYAELLACGDASRCYPEAFVMPVQDVYRLIDERLSTRSPHTRSNTKKDIGFLLRQGWDMGLIPLPVDSSEVADGGEAPPGVISRRRISGGLPRRMPKEAVARHRRDQYGLAVERWGIKLRGGYDDWMAWVTKPSPFDAHRLPNRAATLRTKTDKMESFFGYLHTVRAIEQEALDFEMFVDVNLPGARSLAESPFAGLRLTEDVGLIEEYALWLRGERLKRKNVQAREVAAVAASVARRCLHEKARSEGNQNKADHWIEVANAISSLRRAIETEEADAVTARHQQTAVTAASGKGEAAQTATREYVPTRDDLLKVARAEFPASDDTPLPIAERVAAARAGHAVALLMMIYHSELHNKRCRELRLAIDTRGATRGRWCLRFAVAPPERSAAKDGERQKIFCYHDVPVAADAVAFLERYVSRWRPVLLRGGESGGIAAKHVFVNARGRPFADSAFSRWIQAEVYRWLGVRANPRTIHALAATTTRAEQFIKRNMLIDEPRAVELIRLDDRVDSQSEPPQVEARSN